MKEDNRKIKIVIGDEIDMSEEVLEVFDDPNKAYDKPIRTIYIKPELLPSLLSGRKLHLMLRIRDKDICMTDLAVTLKRKLAAVSRDVRELEGHGIITVEKRGRHRYPKLSGTIEVLI